MAASMLLFAVAACSGIRIDASDPGASATGALAGAGSACEISIATCPKSRSLGGIITDWDPAANTNEALCLSRAAVFQQFCGTPLPVTALYVVSGAVEASQTAPATSPYTSADIATYYTDLPAFPTATSLPPVTATASSSYAGYPATNAIDYAAAGSTWNAGTGASSWILIDYGVPQPIATLQLVVNEAPSGPAHHQIWVGNDANALTLALDVSDSFADGEVLTVHLADSTPPARYVEVKTLSTVSWASWGHITAFGPHAPTYFGFYDSAATFEFTDATAAVESFTNTSWVFGPTLASDVALLAESQAASMSVMLSVQTTFFAGATLLPAAQYDANWSAMAAQIAPYVANGTIVSFYPFDEPYTQGLKSGVSYAQMQAQLETVASVIKASFPSAKITMLFTIDDFATLAEENIVPTNYDWISFDCYGSWTACGAHSIPWYVGQIERHLYPGQQVLLFPDTSIFVPTGSSAAYDSYWITNPTWGDNPRLLNYLQLARTDPNIVGVFGFLYQSYVTGSDTWVGAADPNLAPVLDTWKSFASGVMGR